MCVCVPEIRAQFWQGRVDDKGRESIYTDMQQLISDDARIARRYLRVGRERVASSLLALCEVGHNDNTLILGVETRVRLGLGGPFTRTRQEGSCRGYPSVPFPTLVRNLQR